MTKEEKYALVDELVEKFQKHPNFYLVDLAGLSVAETNDLRRKCFEQQVELRMVKNTLIEKALDRIGGDFDDIKSVLTQSTSVLFLNEEVKEPARMLKSFKADKERPDLKGAYLQENAVVGEKVLDRVIGFRGKKELLGELIGLLQSPMKNVISALQAGGPNKVAGLVKALEDRHAN
jgi:large subunit ribosomal protein L10